MSLPQTPLKATMKASTKRRIELAKQVFEFAMLLLRLAGAIIALTSAGN